MAYGQRVTRYAKSERTALADTLTAVGPDAPTLCTGWTARDLLAHLLLRERHPVAASGVLLKPMKGYTERRQQAIARRDYAGLIAQLRKPPVWSPVSNPLTDEVANTLEMYVHHEDVRRAQPNWRPRAIDPGLEKALWNAARRSGRFALRKFPAALVIESPDHGRVSAGSGGPEVSLRGRPGELAMFLTGRQQVTDVALTGPEELVERLRNARLGV
jgi:uncharacterized protein (TIGR03085 family)